MAGWDDQIFANLPGSPRRPKPPPDQRSLMQTMFPVDPREVVGGLMNQATEGAGNLTAGAARRVGLPNPDLLGHDVTGFLQSPTFGGGASPMAAAPAVLAAAPLAVKALAPEARTAEEIATGTRAAQAATASDAATQAARAAQASPGQAALDQMMRGGQAAAPGAAETAAKTGITAYHGSPYSFDRFDISKIGTGEGAQAYGRGLYFAQNEDVAKEYRDTLSKLDFSEENLTDEGRAKFEEMQTADPWRSRDSALNILPERYFKPTGSMYQVNINADPDHFLDWDKPLSEQQPNVREAYFKAHAQGDPLTEELLSGLEPDNYPVAGLFKQSSGGQAVNTLAETLGGHQQAAQALQQAGIPGIKYLDQGSRGAAGEGGTQNYVTFSDDMIDILRKYGLAGLGLTAGAGALSASGQSPVSSPASAAPSTFPPGTTLNTQPNWSP
jgi:hypothetical protein